MNIGVFMRKLKLYKNTLTLQQYRTLKGQAISSDVVGANRGLENLLKRGVKIAN